MMRSNHKYSSAIYYVLIGLLILNIPSALWSVENCVCERHDKLGSFAEAPHKEHGGIGTIPITKGHHGGDKFDVSEYFQVNSSHNSEESCDEITCDNDNDFHNQQIIFRNNPNNKSILIASATHTFAANQDFNSKIGYYKSPSIFSQIYLQISALLI